MFEINRHTYNMMPPAGNSNYNFYYFMTPLTHLNAYQKRVKFAFKLMSVIRNNNTDNKMFRKWRELNTQP